MDSNAKDSPFAKAANALEVLRFSDFIGPHLDQEPQQDLLWHYTTLAGARGIIERREIWMTSHRFMNDPTECQLADGLIEMKMRERFERANYVKGLSWDRYWRDVSQWLEVDHDPLYLTSLSEDQDALSQWAMYGDDGAGVALGFAVHPDRLTPVRRMQPQTQVSFARVMYMRAPSDGGIASERIDKILDEVFEAAEAVAGALGGQSAVEELALIGIILLATFRPLLKTKTYEHEREWRVWLRADEHASMVGPDTDGDAFGFIDGPNAWKPYVRVRIGGGPHDQDAGLVLRRVRLGPKQPKEAVRSAELLLRRNDILASVGGSSVEYRG